MGQVALGFRSLLIKAAVFVLLAALLAWALGGTLWPRPHSATGTMVDFAGRSFEWRVYVDEHEAPHMWWALLVNPALDEPPIEGLVSESGGRSAPVADDAEPLIERRWAEASVLERSVDGRRLIFAGRALGEQRWTIGAIKVNGPQGGHQITTRHADTRFEAMEIVEQQRMEVEQTGKTD